MYVQYTLEVNSLVRLEVYRRVLFAARKSLELLHQTFTLYLSLREQRNLQIPICIRYGGRFCMSTTESADDFVEGFDPC